MVCIIERVLYVVIKMAWNGLDIAKRWSVFYQCSTTDTMKS